MDAAVVGRSALVGWRKKLGDPVAGAVAARTHYGDEQVRAIIGAAFLALSTYYVVTTMRRLAQELRRT